MPADSEGLSQSFSRKCLKFFAAGFSGDKIVAWELRRRHLLFVTRLSRVRGGFDSGLARFSWSGGQFVRLEKLCAVPYVSGLLQTRDFTPPEVCELQGLNVFESRKEEEGFERKCSYEMQEVQWGV
jgi:hypothetical protein